MQDPRQLGWVKLVMGQEPGLIILVEFGLESLGSVIRGT